MNERVPVRILGCEHYLVDRVGRVFSTMKGGTHQMPRAEPYLLKPWIDPDGYEQVILHKGRKGLYKRYAVHRVVALTFLGAPPLPDHEVRHLDGNRRNNVVENLAWGSRAQNAQDKVQHGRSSAGERNAKAKVTADQVRLIRTLAACGTPQKEIAARFGLIPNSVHRIVRRHMWRHVP